MFILFMCVLLYNVYFLALWTVRFVTILFRVHFSKLKHFKLCSWLKHMEIKTYDEDLIEAVLENQLKSHKVISDAHMSHKEDQQ
jgi:hypothetical protein